MEKVWNWLKRIDLWDVGAFIMAVGITIIVVGCISFIWDSQEAFAVKLGLTGAIIGVYGLFVMLAGLR